MFLECVMENQLLENRDISEYQELFAYEMTEVLLNLKDEFSVVSEPEALRDAMESVPVSDTLSPDSFFIPAVLKMERVINSPTVPTLTSQTIPAVAQTKKAVALPELVAFKAYALPEVATAEKSVVAPSVPTLTCHAIPAIASTEKAVALPELPVFEVYALPVVAQRGN